jgi:hypothetical protein
MLTSYFILYRRMLCFRKFEKNSIISLFGTLYQIKSVSRLNYFVEQSENRTQALNEDGKVMVINATFSNISDISWRSVVLVEETGVPGENHRTVASPWHSLSTNVESSTPRHERDSHSQIAIKIISSLSTFSQIAIKIISSLSTFTQSNSHRDYFILKHIHTVK